MSSKSKNGRKEVRKQEAVNQISAKRPESDKNRNKGNSEKKRYLIFLLIVAAAGIIGIIIAVINFYGKDKIRRNASTTIEFTYDGAAHNLTPNGEQFSISGLTDKDIISKALEKTGFSDKYAYEDIVSNIGIKAGYPSDVIDKIKDYNSLYDFTGSRSVSVNDYYPTIFQIQLFDDFDEGISDSSLKTIVNAIVEEYKQEFIKKYIHAFDVDDVNSLLNLSDYDYAQRVKILKLRLGTVKQYASEMFNEDISFKYKGMSFNDFCLKCEMLENDSLSNIEASVMTDVLTTSVTRLRNQYEYEIKLLENELVYKNENLEEVNSLIDSYKTDGRLYIGSGDSLVVVEGNSKETYEKLVDKKREIFDRIVNIGSEIEKYKLYLSDLKTAAGSSNSKNELINDKLDEVNAKVSELEESFGEMMTAYNKTIIGESDIVIGATSYQGASLISGSFIVTAVKCAAPLCIIALIAISFYAMILEIKKNRKTEQMSKEQN